MFETNIDALAEAYWAWCDPAFQNDTDDLDDIDQTEQEDE